MRRAAIAVMAIAIALAAWGGSDDGPAEASCIQSVTYLGAPFLGVSRIDGPEVGNRVGTAAIPPCDDVVVPPGGPPIVEDAPAPVRVHRVRGVAPRLGFALPAANGRETLMVRAEGPCPLGPVDRALACLRRKTERLVEGPSLIAPPSAHRGQEVRLAVRIRDPRLRRFASHGLDSYFQRKVDGRWRSRFQLQHPLPGAARVPDPGPVGGGVRAIGLPVGRAFPVRLPHVDAGQYRIAKEVTIGGRARWIFAPITIVGPSGQRRSKPRSRSQSVTAAAKASASARAAAA